MISLEYLIAQHQQDDQSVAINSTRQRQQNPCIVITRNNGNIIWRLTGLNVGNIETIEGQPRATRLDFYIGMEDLIDQRQNFLLTTGVSQGMQDGIRIPVGTERVGGRRIRWNGAIGRIEDIIDIDMTIPPFRLTKNADDHLTINIDKETSPYPIVGESGRPTTKELHIGLQHNFIINTRRNLRIPRIRFEMTENQYATILDFIDRAIEQYNN